ncbi:Methyltransferase-like protein 5, partial [Tetrabaena socialis]
LPYPGSSRSGSGSCSSSQPAAASICTSSSTRPSVEAEADEEEEGVLASGATAEVGPAPGLLAACVWAKDIAPFPNPKVELEQYPTGPHLASRLLFAVDSSYDEFGGRTVADLGCGTAMLAIGAALLGSTHVVGVDIDLDALEVTGAREEEVAQDNAAQFEEPLPGVDMAFLRAAFTVSAHSVYSLHKSSTRDFIAKTATRELGAKRAEVLAQLRYDLPATMKFHKQKSVDIEVDLWRFEVGDKGGGGRG